MSLRQEFEKAYFELYKDFPEEMRACHVPKNILWAAQWAFSKAAEEARKHRAAESPDELLPQEIAEAIMELSNELRESEG